MNEFDFQRAEWWPPASSNTEMFEFVGGPADGRHQIVARCMAHGDWPCVTFVDTVNGVDVEHDYLLDEASGKYAYVPGGVGRDDG